MSLGTGQSPNRRRADFAGNELSIGSVRRLAPAARAAGHRRFGARTLLALLKVSFQVDVGYNALIHV